MTISESTVNIVKAIHSVQQEVNAIEKRSTGQVGSRQYKYANLNDIWDQLRPVLDRNKLTVIQSPTSTEHGGMFFQTMIYHESGEFIADEMVMTISREDPQGIGAAITYYRRYMLTSMLGLVTDEDVDASPHRLATAQQKAQIVGAIKQVYPEIKANEIVEAIQNIVGKHPSSIREDEADEAIKLIKAFKE